jgi:hypothetical protein
MSKIQISESAGLIIAANVGAFFWVRPTVKLPEPGQILNIVKK